MGKTIVITPNVINTINALPTEERLAITAALASELILGKESASSLTPVQAMVFSMIKDYVDRDTERCMNGLSITYNTHHSLSRQGL